MSQTNTAAPSAMTEHSLSAAQQAYETATNKENKAENKYDTLGLEAAYLAEGQSRRVTQFSMEIEAYKSLPLVDFKSEKLAGVGAFIEVNDEQGNALYFFIGPVSGGLCFNYIENNMNYNVRVITPASPIGKAIIGLEAGEEFSLSIKDQTKIYEIACLI